MKFSLIKKMILFILCPAILGLAVLGFLSERMAANVVKEKINLSFSEMTKMQTGELKNISLLIASTVSSFGMEEGLLDFLLAHVYNDAIEISLQRRKVELRMDKMKKTVPLLDQIGVLLPDGTCAAHISRKIGEKRDYISPDGKPYIITRRSKTTGKIAAHYTVPVVTDDEVIGHAYATVDMTTLGEITTNKLRIGKAGYAFLLSQDGFILTHPDKKLYGKNIKDLPHIQKILAQKKGAFQAPHDGKATLFVFDTYDRAGWTIVIRVPISEILNNVNALGVTILILALVIIAMVSVMIFVVAKNIVNSLKDVTDFADTLERGDLEISSRQADMLVRHNKRTDEIGTLAGSIHRTAKKLIDIVKQAQEKTEQAEKAATQARNASQRADESAREAAQALQKGRLEAAEQLSTIVAIVSSASEQLSAQIEQSSHGAEQQAAKMAEAAANVEEMNSTVLEVARNASQAAENADHARKETDDGKNVVVELVEAIEEVNNQAGTMTQQLSGQGSRTENIGRIMDVITDIADQTNLLALNAAIEAAHAGEAGLGFAVVADEVRKLAEKTMNATREVGQAISEIQDSTKDNIEAMEKAGKAVEHTNNLAGRAGALLNSILKLVEDTADQIRNIATASEQQSCTSEEISRTVSEVNSISAQTSDAMHRALSAVADLRHQTQEMVNLVEDLKKE